MLAKEGQRAPPRIRRLGRPALAISGFLLLVVLVPSIGMTVNGSRRWISLGNIGQLQPSELAKVALALWLAGYVAANGGRLRTPGGLAPPLIVTGVLGLLILIEPDMGTATSLCVVALAMLIVAGARMRHIGAVVGSLFLLATIAFAVLGLMGSLRLGRIASFSIIVSSGTLLAALGMGTVSVTSAALFYMLGATLSVSALFLLVELIERIGAEGKPPLRDVDLSPGEDTNLDDAALPLVGRAFPVSLALLGLAFMCCALVVAGLPPLSGFIAKFSILTAILGGERGTLATAGAVAPPGGWLLFALLLVSGLAAIISLSRAGIRHFWSPGGQFAVRLQSAEAAAVVTLLLSCVLLAARAERVMLYTRATAAALHAPESYIETVLSTKARPGPKKSTSAREGAP